ncbi:MAG: RHS repeat-associated core domain-containing protein, partial [Verrucomicrobiota bacterium]
GNAAPVQNEYGFAGERFDANAQGYHLRSRFYNPNTGRLIGEDPFEGFLQLPASLHRYTYAQNDPVNLSDPSGTYPTLAGMMMKMMGADPMDVAMHSLRSNAQHSVIQTNKALVRTVGAYLRKLQEDHFAGKKEYAPGEEPPVGRLTGGRAESNRLDPDGARIFEYREDDMDRLVPPDIYTLALRDLQAGRIGSGLFNALDLVANLTERGVASGHGSTTIGMILGSLNKSAIAFGSHWGRVIPNEANSAPGLTHTAANPGLNMRVTEFYAPPEKVEPEVVDATDVVPPRFMRVALNGRAIPDAPPTMDTETDQKPVETYVHAAYLQLQHEVSDISVPLSGGELSLEVRRSFEGENWDESSDVYPEMLPDKPFGLGWGSNLSAGIRFTRRVAPPTEGRLVTNNDGSMDVQDGSPLWGNYAYVRDETGTETRFVILYKADGNEVFLPMPTSRRDQDTAMLKLEKVGPTRYVFTRKFGTKLFFDRPQDGGADRARYRTKEESWGYARLAEVQDRFGSRIIHDYNRVDLPLRPTQIRAVTGNSIRVIGISYNQDGLVETITDPRGKHHRFCYSKLRYTTRYHEREVSVLTSVLAPAVEAGKAETRYGYELDDAETRTFVQKHGFDPDANTYYHFNLKGIHDPNGKDHWFNYTYNWSHLNFWKKFQNKPSGGTWPAGYYPKKGQARLLSSVVFPPLVAGGEPIASYFFDHSRIYADAPAQKGGAGDAARREASRNGTRRVTMVTDTEGNSRIYDFDRFQCVPLATYEPHMAPNLDGIDLSKVRSYVPHLYEHIRCHIVHMEGSQVLFDLSQRRASYLVSGKIGYETLEYNPDAGLEIARITDFGGNTIDFEYGDDWSLATRHPQAAALEINFPFARHRDVTKRTRSGPTLLVPLVRTFQYYDVSANASGWRVLRSMTDEEGRVTTYTLNTLGQTTEQRVTDATGLLQQTLFHYNDPQWPSFLTRQDTVKQPGDPAWAVTLSTVFEADPLTGLTAKTVVNPGGLALTTLNKYDENGNRTESTDARGQTTYFTYDALNQLIQVQAPKSDLETVPPVHDFFYDLCGNKVSEQDANGVVTDYGYDTWNRLTTTVRRMGGRPEDDLVQSMTYNLVDSVVSKTDAKGNVSRMSYDGLQRLTVTQSPAPFNYQTRFYYDTAFNAGASGLRPAGFQPTRIVDARGFETRAWFDGAYRKVREERQIETGAAGRFTRRDYRYDKVSNVRFTDVKLTNGVAGVLT